MNFELFCNLVIRLMRGRGGERGDREREEGRERGRERGREGGRREGREERELKMIGRKYY